MSFREKLKKKISSRKTKPFLSRPVAGEWTISPIPASLFSHIKSLYRQRTLLGFMMIHCFRSVYAAAILGVGWLFIRPIITAAIVTVVLHNVLGVTTEPVPYLVYVLVGMSLWVLLQRGVAWTTRSFLHHGRFATRFGMSPMLIHVSSITPSLIEWLILVVVAISAMLIFSLIGTESFIDIGWNFLYFPIISFWVILFVFGISCVSTVLNNVARDTWYILRYLLMALVAVSPVYYPLHTIPLPYRDWLLFNPVTPLVEYYRYAFFGTKTAEIQHLMFSLTLILGLLVFSLWFFARYATRSLESK